MHPSEIGRRRVMRNAALNSGKPRHQDRDDIFRAVNDAARWRIRELAERWLPTTRMSGDNLLALNPTRDDRNIGSFSINVRTAKWADFATDDRGSDIVSLYAYLHGVSQIEAARTLANLLGVRA